MHLSSLLGTLLLRGACGAVINSRSTDPVRALPREVVAGGTGMRILPLGDSITYGYKSTNGNGYRGELQTLLSGSNSLFIGSVSAGTMQDNCSEYLPLASSVTIAARRDESEDIAN
jgi:hypothetical protein